MDRVDFEPQLEIIATGHELLDGTIADTNTQRLALRLKPLGLRLTRTTVIADDPAAISRALVEAATRSQIIFVSGGLGPTTDDLTLDVAAQTFGVKLVRDRRAHQNVLKRLKRFGRRPNAANLKQSYVPEGSHVLQNDEGTAPGVKWTLGDRVFYFLPGVPREFNHLFDRHIVSDLAQHRVRRGTFLFTVKVYGVPESELSEWVGTLRLPASVGVGFRTHLPENHIKFDVSATSQREAERVIRPLLNRCQKRFGTHFFGINDQTFAQSLVLSLTSASKTLALAESCTGGLASSMVTAVPGSSAVFLQGVVTYSNEAKVRLLGVSEEALKKWGAVSEEVVTQMAKGALVRSGADFAVAITGVAGPTGGSRQKPVGTVWLAIASHGLLKTKKLTLGYDRELNQRASAYAALQLVRDSLNPS